MSDASNITDASTTIKEVRKPYIGRKEEQDAWKLAKMKNYVMTGYRIHYDSYKLCILSIL
jgi:hypothetical protein